MPQAKKTPLLDEIQKNNANHTVNNYSEKLSAALWPIVLFSITGYIFIIGGGWAFFSKGSNFVGVIFRCLPGIFCYWQGDEFRKRVLVKMPENLFAQHIYTFISGLAYYLLIIMIIFYANLWFLIFGLMMLVLSARSGLCWNFLKNNDESNPLKTYFGKWSLAALGYAILIFGFSPIFYTIKLNVIETEGTMIYFPFDLLKMPAKYYIDLCPSLTIIIAMFFSIFRINNINSEINTKLELHYEIKVAIDN
jgi:hypothetical protein